MSTIKKRVEQLEAEQRRRLCEELIRQFEVRTPQELLFYALHGYYETVKHNNRSVSEEEIDALDKKLTKFSRGRTDADLIYFSEHGLWP